MLAGGLGLNVDAVMEASLRYASGALAHVHLDYVQRPPQHTLEIVGESGFVRWNGFTGDLDICAAADGAWTHETPPAGFERNDMFLDEMRNFLRVARGESSPMCSLEEGLCVQWIIERIRASAEGGMPDDGSAPDGSVMPHPGPTKRTGRSGGATG
jgi:predicted dehydrogenase